MFHFKDRIIVDVYNKFIEGFDMRTIAYLFDLDVDEVDEIITEAMFITGIIQS